VGEKQSGSLEGIREISGKARVMLAQGDAVESQLDRPHGLPAQLAEGLHRIELLMQVEDHEDAAVGQWVPGWSHHLFLQLRPGGRASRRTRPGWGHPTYLYRS
jgi:hypothetical protein